MVEDNEIQYWAGGFYWGNESQYEDFIKEKRWRVGWTHDDQTPAAIECYRLIENIKVNDKFALKSLGGRYDLTIFALGKVINVDKKSEGEIGIEWELDSDKTLYYGKAPGGEGAGNWFNALLEVKRDADRLKIFNIKTESSLPTDEIEMDYIKEVNIENFFSIENANIKNNSDNPSREIYLLGENGDGKTLILQSILLSAKMNSIESKNIEFINQILDNNMRLNNKKANKPLLLKLKSDGLKNIYKYVDKFEDSLSSKNNSNEEEKFIKNIYAYGVSRSRNDSDKKDETGFMTLFDSNCYLNNPVKWLQYLYTKDLENEKNKIPADTIALPVAKEILINLLGEGKDLKIEVRADRVTFKEKNSDSIQFDQLSEGYKSVMTWVCDLLSRLAERQPNIKPEKNSEGKMLLGYQAIVLVDEIDLHLHPKWANKIVSKLRAWFPNIQFFFTTHSPIVILGASDNAVIYKVYKEEGITKISEPVTDLSEYVANSLITSPLFDLETMASRSFNKRKLENLSSDDFIYKQIHTVIAQRMKENPGIMNEEEIQKWAIEELDKLENVK